MTVHTTFGARLTRASKRVKKATSDNIVANSQTIKKGNLLVTDGDGYMSRIAGGTGRPTHIAEQEITSASDNETVAQLPVLCREIDPDDSYYMRANADLVQGDLNEHFRTALSTNTHLVDKTTGVEATAGNQVLKVVELDPYKRGDARDCLVQFVKRG